MAELKEFQQYDINIPQEIEPVREEQPVLTYPKKKLQNISRAEKVIVALMVVAFLTIAVLTVKLTTTISQAEEDISVILQDITEQESRAAKLEQEKSELSRTERIKQAAEKAGLTVEDENIRNVKK